MVFLPVPGNHEGLALHYFAQFALPGDELNYHVRYGNAVIVLLSDDPQHDGVARAAGYLRAAMLDNPDARWRVVVNHRALYSSSSHGSQADLQAAWGPIIDEFHIDLVLNGHDHNYERSVLIANGQRVFEKGTTYMVASGVGAPLYPNGSSWFTATSEEVESEVSLEFAGSTLNVFARRLDGTVIDSFALRH